MDWAVELSRGAEKDLKRLPRDIRERLIRAVDELQEDPFRGDVRPLKGPEWKGRYRKRVGSYRIIFTPNHQAKALFISAVLIRSEKTYR
ncbi:MAG TPA: type II toxin-antitoxin system RelE/ParE family toxin [Terriglobia bacterium]|nr:type II toxin-antitoxin system RelE/ParE family toxin [Terriglobia bacterium]